MRLLAALGWLSAAFLVAAVIFLFRDSEALRDREQTLWDQIQRYDDYVKQQIRADEGGTALREDG